jgi:serine/threonine protein kinase
MRYNLTIYFIKNTAPWETAEFLKIALQLVEGISLIHQRGIIHQSVNTRHILINRNTTTAKFIDFSQSTPLNTKTQVLAIAAKNLENTLEYISPGRSRGAIVHPCVFFTSCTYRANWKNEQRCWLPNWLLFAWCCPLSNGGRGAPLCQ